MARSAAGARLALTLALVLPLGSALPLPLPPSPLTHEPAHARQELPGPQDATAALPADVALEFVVRDACADRGRAWPALPEVPDWRVRAARLEVAWRLEWLGLPADTDPSWMAAALDAHPHVRRMAWRSCHHAQRSWSAEGELLDRLLADARDPWEPLRAAATGALGWARGEGVEAALEAALGDASADVAWQAALAWPERWIELDAAQRGPLAVAWLGRFDALSDPSDRFSTLLLHGWRSAWPAEFWEALWPASRAVGLEPERRALLAAGLLTALDRSPLELSVASWTPHVARALELSPFGAPLFDAAFQARGEPWGAFALEAAGQATGRELHRWLRWACLGLGAERWSAGVLGVERDREWLEQALRVAEEYPGFGARNGAAWSAAIERAGLWEAWLEVLIRVGQQGLDWAAALLIEELENRSLERRLQVIAALGAIGVDALEPQREAQLRTALWGEWLTLTDADAWGALPDLAERRPTAEARDRLASLGRFDPERRPRLGAVLALRTGDGEVRLTLERWLAEDPFAYGRAEAAGRPAVARRLSGLLGTLHRGFPAESGESAAELLAFAIGRDTDLGRSAVRVLEAHPERRALLFGQLREGVELEVRAEALRAIAAARPELSEAELTMLAGWARRDAPRLSPRQAGELLDALASYGGEPVRALLIDLLRGPEELPLFAADGLARLPGERTSAALAAQVRTAGAFESRRSALMALGVQARAESGEFARLLLDQLLAELDRLAADASLERVRELGYRNAEVPEVWSLLLAQCRELQVRAGRWEPQWSAELWSAPLASAAADLERRFSAAYLARADARWPLAWSFIDALARTSALDRATGAPLPWWRCDARGLLDLDRRARELDRRARELDPRARELDPRASEGSAGAAAGGELALLEAGVAGLLGEGPRARADLREALEELAAVCERRGEAKRAARIRERARLLAPGRPWPA